ncbi:hypothetical protein DLJ59_24975, partial [Micromonospora inaquosa]
MPTRHAETGGGGAPSGSSAAFLFESLVQPAHLVDDVEAGRQLADVVRHRVGVRGRSRIRRGTGARHGTVGRRGAR